MNPYTLLKTWRFVVDDQGWDISRIDEKSATIADERGQDEVEVSFINGQWVMAEGEIERLEEFRLDGTAAAILAFLNEHGVPWMQSSWSSTPPTSGDMLAQWTTREGRPMRVYLMARTVRERDVWEIVLTEQRTLFTHTALKVRATQWGWQFRPLTSPESS